MSEPYARVAELEYHGIIDAGLVIGILRGNLPGIAVIHWICIGMLVSAERGNGIF